MKRCVGNKWMGAALGLVMTGTAFGSALAAQPAWQPADGEVLYWQLTDDKDKPIGQMIQRFSRDQGVLTMQRTQKIRMRKFMMSIKLDQEITSVWDKQGLRSLKSATIADVPLMSQDLTLNVERQDDGTLSFASSELGERSETEQVWPMTLWHRSFLRHDRLFDAGLGMARPITKSEIGTKQVTVEGKALSCDGYRVDTINHEDKPVKMELWYTQAGEPCMMYFEGPMGSSTAQRVTEPALHAMK